MFRSIQTVRMSALAAVVAALSACSGSNSDSTAPSSGLTTTLGTRSSVSDASVALTSNGSATWQDYSRDEDYPKVLQLPLQFITLKSGQKLGVLVSVPADSDGNAVSGSFPVVLTQTAYRIDVGALTGDIMPKGATLLVGGVDRFMIQRGYITVAVDVLGSGVSDGTEVLLGSDEQEAYGETVDWVAQQPWCDGNIGVAGTSYLAITSLLTAEQQHPAVKAAFVDVPMGDPWRAVIGTGGMLNSLFLSIWLPLTQALSVQNEAAIAKYPQYAAQITAANQQHIDTIDSFFIPLINSGLNGDAGTATDDGDFWSQRSVLENTGKIQIPTFIIGASNDIFQRDEPLIYEKLKHNVNTKLVIVPGAHVESVTTAMTDADNADQTGAPGSPTLLLKWFDQYLKGMDNGVDKLPNVTQYVAGYSTGSKPRFAVTTDWPHPQASPQRLYLHGDLTLSAQAPTTSEDSHTVTEPDGPTISVGKSQDGTILLLSSQQSDGSNCSISFLQWTLGLGGIPTNKCYDSSSKVEKTQKALTFQTAAMTRDFYFNGPLEADIWMSSTSTDAEVSVRVDDVAPDGTVSPITNGLMSAAYRAVDETRSRYLKGEMIQPWHPFTVASMLPVTPGLPMMLPVEIFPTAALIRSGHRLQVAISASNQAQGGWSNPSQVNATGGVNTILNDADHPSSVVLPVVPASVLN